MVTIACAFDWLDVRLLGKSPSVSGLQCPHTDSIASYFKIFTSNVESDWLIVSGSTKLDEYGSGPKTIKSPNAFNPSFKTQEKKFIFLSVPKPLRLTTFSGSDSKKKKSYKPQKFVGLTLLFPSFYTSGSTTQINADPHHP